ncbi:MAG: hypothetical protein AMXMBFR57_09960 [Acidimicrobiia bacterium]
MRVMIAPLRVLLVAGLILTLGHGQPEARQQTAQAPQPAPSPLQQLAAKFAALGTDEQRKEMAAANPELMTAEAAWEVRAVGNVFLGGNLAAARRTFDGLLWLGQQLQDQRVIANAYLGIGGALGRADSSEEALEWFTRALEIVQRINDLDLLRATLNNLGITARRLGQLDAALTYAREAVAVAGKLPDSDREAAAYTTLGQVHAARREMTPAMAAFSRALELRTDDGSDGTRGLITTLTNVGNFYNELGDLVRAEQYYQRAIALAEKLGEGRARAEAVPALNLANVFVAQGRLQDARPLLNRLRTLAESTRSAALYTSVLHNLANLDRDEGKLESALEMHKEVLAIRESGGPSVAMVETLTELGRIYLGLGKLDDAFGYLKRAQDIADRTSDPGARARATIFLAACYDARGEWDEALRLYDTARGLVERMRLVIDEGEARQAFLAWRQAPYLGVAAAHASLGRPAEALVAIEGARARTLLDLIDDDGGRALLASKTDTQTAIQQVLPPGTGAMEFVVESERVWVYLIKATPDGLQVRVEKLPHTQADVTALATRFADSIATRDLGFVSAGQALYDVLLSPYEAWLADVTHLVLVPDGVLWRVPFQALRPAGGDYLIERMAVSYAPSLAAKAALQARATTRTTRPVATLLAMGDPVLPAELKRPALPQARREVNAIAALYGATRGRVFVGDDATSEALRSHAPNASVLHIATHGVLEDAAPMSSHVLLAGSEGRFEARDWLGLKLSADVVVLSACQTARGALGGGEGIIGLTWGVFASGASSAVVSQWEVDSASTTSLMIALHTQLMAQQDSAIAPAEALRAAARSMLADARYRHPFYWAGFVAIGR